MAKSNDEHLWALTHAERATLVDDLTGLDAEQWHHLTLCGKWVVQQVVAHLTQAASTNQWQWLRSMIRAGFRPELHNQRLLKRHLGKTPAEALERFRAVINSTVVPSGDTPAWLG